MHVKRSADLPLGRLGDPWRRALTCLGFLLCVFLPTFADEPDAQHVFRHGVLIRFEGVVSPRQEQYLYRQLKRAKEKGADVVVVEIDSPGGHLEQSIDVASRLRGIDWAHTVAYIPEEALSGAAMMAFGCDEIIMDKSARMGDVGVIMQEEFGMVFRHAPEKIRSHVATVMRELAIAKGRPPALAEAMVNMDLTVFEVNNRKTGEKTFMTDDEIKSSDDPDGWEKIKPILESREGQFLEVSGARAVELQLAEGIAVSRAELKTHLGLKQDFLVLEFTAVDTAVFILNHPLVTGLLIVVGLIALYVEFSAPGISIGGLLAGLCFALFFWSRFLGGTAGMLELVLFAAGVAFLLVELFVLPGFGVSGLTGLLLILASLILAGQTFIVPETSREVSTLIQTLLVVLGSGAVVTVAAVGLTYYFGDVPVLGRLALRPPAQQPGHASQAAANTALDTAATRQAIAVGDTGWADSTLRPAGITRFGDDYVDVVTEGGFVEEGSRVKVIQIVGNRVIVRPVDPPG